MLNCTRIGLLLLTAWMIPTCFASTDQPDSFVAKANRISSLTGPGAKPFHLKFTISEPANPASPYTATIEEYWKSKNDWTRSIDSPKFQQHLVVNSGNRTEQNQGNYYPLWLREFVMAAIMPLQDASFWKEVGARIVTESFANGHQSSSCARAQFKIGTAAANNDAFAIICFNADGTLSSVIRPGYGMEFHDPKPFGKKRVAYRYVEDPEPGTELVGQIQILERLDSTATIPDLQPLGQQAPGAIPFVIISQDTFEKLLLQPLSIVWPPVHSGNTKGMLSMYVSVGRDGKIREAYPLNSDNASLQDAARDQLLKVQLKQAIVQGQPVQTEAALTFKFSTSLDSSPVASPSISTSQPKDEPIGISSAAANHLLIRSFAPIYPLDLKRNHVGGVVELTAIIGKQGQVISLTPVVSPNAELTSAAIAAVQRWTYKPYLPNGIPTEFRTAIKIVFEAP